MSDVRSEYPYKPWWHLGAAILSLMGSVLSWSIVLDITDERTAYFGWLAPVMAPLCTIATAYLASVLIARSVRIDETGVFDPLAWWRGVTPWSLVQKVARRPDSDRLLLHVSERRRPIEIYVDILEEPAAFLVAFAMRCPPQLVPSDLTGESSP